jgi:hypothetical protein
MPLKDAFKNTRKHQVLEEPATVKNLDVKKEGKPSIFIGSSTESLDTAQFIKDQFDPSIFEVDIWDEGVFGRGKTNVEWLKNFTDIYDFAIFIFVPEDEIMIQTREDASGQQLKGKATRHNVVFEFGLFLGRIGSKKTYILYDEDTKDFIDYFFTDLQYHPDEPENHYVSLYAYKGQYDEWVKSEKKIPQFVASSLQPQVQKISTHILKNTGEVEIGFLPSTSLAIGYYKNFIQIVTDFLHTVLLPELPEKLETAGKSDSSINETITLVRNKKSAVVRIIWPDALTGAEHAILKNDYEKAGLIRKNIPGVSRPMSVNCLPENRSAAKDQFIIYDIPSTMNSSIDAIDLLNPHKDIRELLSEKERRNFRKAIEHLINSNKILASYVEIITIEEFRKETSN